MKEDTFYRRDWKVGEKLYCLVYEGTDQLAKVSLPPAIREGKIVLIDRIIDDSKDFPARTKYLYIRISGSSHYEKFAAFDSNRLHLRRSSAISALKAIAKSVRIDLLDRIELAKRSIRLCEDILAW